MRSQTEQVTGDTTRGISAGIVADDLTGATDSAVQFAQDGWAARLALTAPSAGSARPASVVAVVTDARAMHGPDAQEATAAAVSSLIDSGIERLFVKIDSTMRGSIPEQIAGALGAWSRKHEDAIAIVCSAYPAMGRTIENGHILVNGEGVHLTSVGTDPVTPVSTSDLRELLPGSVHIVPSGASGADPLMDHSADHDAGHGADHEAGHGAMRAVDPAALRAALLSALDDGARIISVDASTDEDLAHLAGAIEELGDRVIPVGAAGLAVAMSSAWKAAGSAPSVSAEARRAVVVVSSLHDVSRTQADYLREHFAEDRIRVLAPTLQEALDPATMSAWADRELGTQERGTQEQGTDPLPELIVIESPSERPADDYTDSHAGETPAAELIADSLATITYRVLEHSPVDALMLLGGEGARAVLSRLGAEALLVRDAIREGIPLGTIEGGTAGGLTVVTKAGGFGSSSTVHEIVTELIDPAAPSLAGSPAETLGNAS